MADPGDVSAAMSDAAEEYPEADGGITYDAADLTFTQWVVRTDDAGSLRDRVQAAFDRTAAGTDLRLVVERADASQEALGRVGSDLADASRTDPAWPTGLAMTGARDPERGTFVIDAGDRADDPAVVAYVETRWPGLVSLSREQPARLE